MKSLRRVLIVQPYGIGDLLFVTPVLRALRLIPTVEKVDLLLGSRSEEAVRHNPHVDEIFSVDKDLFHRRSGFDNFLSVISLGRKLRSQNYDLLLDYSLRGEYAFFSRFFLGISRRAGFGYKRRGFFHNIRLPLQEGFKDRHVADYFCDLAEMAGVPVEDRWMEFFVHPSDRENIEPWVQSGQKPLRRFLVVSPGGGESWGKDAYFRRWPISFFAPLVEKLVKTLDFDHCFIVGSPKEAGLGDDLARQVSVPITNLAGKTSFSEAAALIEKSSLCVANDGGLIHLIHSFRVPLISFYGPVNPDVYGPYPVTPEAIAVVKEGLSCRPCYQRFRYNSACLGRECLEQLTPDEVWDFLEARQFFTNISALS